MTSLVRQGRGRLLALLIVNGLGQAGAAIAAALAVEYAFSRLGPVRAAPAEIVRVGLVLAGVATVTAWLRSRERVDAERLGQSYTHDLRMELFARLTAMSPRAVGSLSQGSTVLRFRRTTPCSASDTASPDTAAAPATQWSNDRGVWAASRQSRRQPDPAQPRCCSSQR